MPVKETGPGQKGNPNKLHTQIWLSLLSQQPSIRRMRVGVSFNKIGEFLHQQIRSVMSCWIRDLDDTFITLMLDRCLLFISSTWFYSSQLHAFFRFLKNMLQYLLYIRRSSIQLLIIKIIMEGGQKIHLPKLKISYSLRHSTEFSPNKSPSVDSLYFSPSVHYPSKSTITQNKQSPFRNKTKSHSNQSVQAKYNSRSPQYFKKLERTDQLIKFLSNHQKVIVDKFPRHNLKPTEKQNLIYQTQQKLKKRFEMKKKDKKINISKRALEHTLTETNYSKFSPSKIPIVKSLQKVQPSPHALYNL